jgi:hypothetical protein
MPVMRRTRDICHGCGGWKARRRCAASRFGILYMPMDSSAPATNSSKPMSGQRTEERADAWLTISAWIWAAYFIGLIAAIVCFVF